MLTFSFNYFVKVMLELNLIRIIWMFIVLFKVFCIESIHLENIILAMFYGCDLLESNLCATKT